MEPGGKQIEIAVAFTTSPDPTPTAATVGSAARPATEELIAPEVEPLAIMIKVGVEQHEERRGDVQFRTQQKGYYQFALTDPDQINRLSCLRTFHEALHEVCEAEALRSRSNGTELSIPTMCPSGQLPMAFAWVTDDKAECLPIKQMSQIEPRELKGALKTQLAKRGLTIAYPSLKDPATGVERPARFPPPTAPFLLTDQLYDYVDRHAPTSTESATSQAKQDRQYSDGYIISAVNVACSLLERREPYWVFLQSHKNVWCQLVRFLL